MGAPGERRPRHVRPERLGGERDRPAAARHGVRRRRTGRGSPRARRRRGRPRRAASRARPRAPCRARRRSTRAWGSRGRAPCACRGAAWSIRHTATGSSPGRGASANVGGPSPRALSADGLHRRIIPLMPRIRQPRSSRTGHADGMTERTSHRHFVPCMGGSALTPFYDLLHRFSGLGGVHAEMIRMAELRPGQRVLDIGCGTGNLLLALGRERPDVELVGLDPDPARPRPCGAQGPPGRGGGELAAGLRPGPAAPRRLGRPGVLQPHAAPPPRRQGRAARRGAPGAAPGRAARAGRHRRPHRPRRPRPPAPPDGAQPA